VVETLGPSTGTALLFAGIPRFVNEKSSEKHLWGERTLLVLVLNSGGSSIKYTLYDMPEETIVARGSVDGLGLAHCTFTHFNPQGRFQEKMAIETHLEGLRVILARLQEELERTGQPLSIAAHKLIHGGPRLGPVEFLTEEAIAEVAAMATVASVHNPPALQGIEALSQLAPDVCQIGVFETGFYTTIPDYASVYGLPWGLAEEYGLRKYGFHGASHRFIAQRVSEFLGEPVSRLISCHLGSGTSVAAIKNGIAIDISSGYTPQSGTMMSTRAGDFDPEVLYFLLAKNICGLEEIRQMLNKESGLAGISGIRGGDLRDIEKAASEGNERARLALDAFCYSIKKYIGAFTIPLEGLDVLVFTGGIGENSPLVRQTVKNRECKGDALISTPASKVRVAVLKTNEEIVVVRQAWEHWRTHR
jgi:acetate kinase